MVVTYQARHADFTGGAANFFLVTPPEVAPDTSEVACSVMTGTERSGMYAQAVYVSISGSRGQSNAQ